MQNDIGVDNMNNDFGALTILAPKCQKCPKVETCDHKQLAHLGYIIRSRILASAWWPKEVMERASVSSK